jgi:Ice-binding-like/Bacterial Ig-like domain
MKTIKGSALILLAGLLAACGQQLVEFPYPGAGGSGPVAPTVVSTDPASGATNVLVTTTVRATFSEAMNGATISATTFTLKQGSTAIGGAVTYAGVTATFTPTASLAASTVYIATITTGARSAAGLAMDAPYTWFFTTAGSGPVAPVVISTVPASAATNVILGTIVSADFSTAMNPATLSTTTFTLKNGAVAVGGGVSSVGVTATFTPSAALATNTLYTAAISTGAQDVAGTPMAAPYTWSFTTGSGAPNPCALLPVVLNAAGNFAVLAGSTVTNTGPTVVTGDLGVSPGSSVTGFPPGSVVGTQHVNDAAANQAKLDLTTAYNDAAGRTLCRTTLPAINLGGKTLAPGLYFNASALEISSGTLTLDAKGDPGAIFIFQTAKTLNASPPGRGIVLAGGAKASNIFWQVGTSATIGTNTAFFGTIMADQAVTLKTGASLNGRALARIAAVTLDSNVIVKPAP